MDEEIPPPARYNVRRERNPKIPQVATHEINEMVERLKAIQERSRKAREQVMQAACLAGPPPCPEHPSELLCLDLESSAAATLRKGQTEFRFGPCPRCQRIRQLQDEAARLHAQGVPANLLHCTFENFKPKPTQEKFKEQCRAFCDLGIGFLVMHGENKGTGKSHLGVSCLRVMGRGRFITQADLLLKLRQSYRENHAEDIIQSCKNTRLLVLDEIGVSAGGRDEFPMLHSILNHRYGEKLPTVLTANLELREFNEHVGVRMVDRLSEAAQYCLHFRGESERRKRRASYREQSTTKQNKTK